MRRPAVLHLSLLCLVLILLAAAQSNVALACSGSGPLIQLEPRIQGADAIVHGRVVRVDDTRRNIVLRVKTYLNGVGGPRHLLVQRLGAQSIDYRRNRSESIRCSYQPPGAMQVGEDVVMFLNRQPNGGYSIAEHIFSEGSYGRFERTDSKVAIGYTLTDSSVNHQAHEVTRRELIDLIQSFSGMTSVEPTDAPFPLDAPLLVTTTSGNTYMVPVDGRPAISLSADELRSIVRFNTACWTEGCVASRRYGHERYTIDGGALHYVTAMGTGSLPSEAVQHGIVFSPTNDAYALWQIVSGEALLTVQTVPVVTTTSFSPEDMHVVTISTPLAFDDAFALGQPLGAWSPDGRMIAFVDSRGLSMWDVFTAGSQSSRIVGDGVTAVHGFSHTGRYLRVTVDGQTQHLDRVTLETLPDGAWSPDDRVLLTFGRNPRFIFTVPPREMPAYDLGNVIVRDATWIGRWSAVVLSCSLSGTCAIVDVTLRADYYDQMPIPYIGHAFDYSRDTGSLVVLKDGRTLTIRHAGAADHREVHFSELDADIAAVEWLPAVFYRPIFYNPIR
jgi:hypothetical protein